MSKWIFCTGFMLLLFAVGLLSQTVVDTITRPNLVPTEVAVYENGDEIYAAKYFSG